MNAKIYLTCAFGMASLVSFSQNHIAPVGAQTEKSNPGDATKLYREAYAAYKNKNYAGALTAIDAALKVESKNADYQSLKAYILIAKGDPDAALASLTEGIRQLPGEALLYEMKANVLSTAGRKDEALPYYEKMLQLDQHNARYYHNYYYALSSLRNFDKILDVYAIYQKASAENPKMQYLNDFEDDLYFYPSIAYYQKGDKKKALELLNIAIQKNPKVAAYYTNRGNIYSDFHDETSALADYNKAIALKPEDDLNYYNRGSVYVQMGRDKEAIEDFNKSEKLGNGTSALYQNRSNAYKHLKLNDRAIADLKKAIELAPENRDLSNNLALLYRDTGKKPQAQSEFDKAVSGENAQLPYYNQASDAYKRHDLKTAVDYLKKAIAAKKDFVDAYNLLGLAYTDLGERNLALEAYTTALRYNEKNAAVYNNRGHLYKIMGNQDAARQDYLTALKYDPTMTPEYYNLAKMYMQQGDAKLAQQYFDLATDSHVSIREYFVDYSSFLLKTRQPQKAVQIAELGARTYPEDYDILINLAGAYQDSKLYDQYFQTLQKAIKISPEKFDAYYNLGNYYFNVKKDYPNAVKSYNQAISKKMPSMEAYLNLASVYQDMGRNDDMLHTWEQLIQQYPDSYEAYYNRAEYFLKSGKTSQAVADFEKSFQLMDTQLADSKTSAYQLNIERSDKALLKAQAYQMLGQYDKAVPAFQMYTAFNTKNADAYSNYAYSLLEVGKPDLALANFNKAYQIKSDEIDIVIGLLTANYLLHNTAQVKEMKAVLAKKFPRYRITPDLPQDLMKEGYFYTEKFMNIWKDAIAK